MSEEMLYSYDGFLKYNMQSAEILDNLRGIVNESGAQILVEPEWLEFSYTGKDVNRKSMTLLSRIAALIKEADGEIECRIERDSRDFWFEFYTIHDGHLFRQEGTVVRGDKKLVA